MGLVINHQELCEEVMGNNMKKREKIEFNEIIRNRCLNIDTCGGIIRGR